MIQSIDKTYPCVHSKYFSEMVLEGLSPQFLPEFFPSLSFPLQNHLPLFKALY